MPLEWYEGPGTPDLTWWWAVEHLGHPAFYLRALVPGDCAPGRLPLARHILTLDGDEDAEAICGTCEQTPRAENLEAIERATGQTGFLGQYRAEVDAGRRKWPTPTAPGSCWQCSNPKVRADRDHQPKRKKGGRNKVKVCPQCESFLASLARRTQ